MIDVEDVAIRAGGFSLSNLSFSIPTGHYGVLMGKTGCGKTTLLEALCGLKPIHSGAIRLMGKEMTHRRPAERELGYVPQDGALFATMTVRRQLAFALEIRHWKKAAMAERVKELAELLGISALLDRYPKGLSGGEAQRVALGRALSWRPPILCLDEPLGALDPDTRVEMCSLLHTIKVQLGVTVIHVTHDLQEAERLADIIFQMEDGRISAQNH
jgi:molybdate/tungstate transport system ATP-binding protein